MLQNVDDRKSLQHILKVRKVGDAFEIAKALFPACPERRFKSSDISCRLQVTSCEAGIGRANPLEGL